MQIEGTKLIFVKNFGVLHLFKCASKVFQIAQTQFQRLAHTHVFGVFF